MGEPEWDRDRLFSKSLLAGSLRVRTKARAFEGNRPTARTFERNGDGVDDDEDDGDDDDDGGDDDDDSHTAHPERTMRTMMTVMTVTMTTVMLTHQTENEKKRCSQA